MQINNNHSNLNFGCIRVNAGGMELLQKEGLPAIKILNEEKEPCEKFLWHLDINSNGYQLINPANKQSYSGPFSIRKHFAKGNFSILMKNINNNTVSFSIPCTKEEISSWYKAIKHATGIDKMIKILKILELKK